MYHPHPSQRLTELFNATPYQGVSPDRARFLFIGLDANYSATIEREPIFSRILEYHDDGKAFWQKYGVHHPFLLPGYTGSGRYYHRSFAEIGFGPEHAGVVSFAELLHLPTTGQSKLKVCELDSNHLRKLQSWVLEGQAEHIFFPAGVVRLLRSSKLFQWLPKKPLGQEGALKILLDKPKKRVYQHLHFSNYGKFLAQKQQEAADIRRLLEVDR